MSKFKNSTRVAFLAVALILAIPFLLSFTNSSSAFSAESAASMLDAKVYSTATLDEDFAENTILVTLNGQSSQSYKTYTTEDFPEVPLASVRDLTAPTVELVQRQIAAEKTRDWSALSEQSDNQMLINREEFRRILLLTLNESGKKSVLQAIKLLETRDDVIAAEPNYIVQGATVPHVTQYNSANQWGLNNANFGIRAQQAWDITTGVNKVIVGIVDSGIDSAHPDLTNRMHLENSHDINTTLHKDYIDGNANDNDFAIVDPVGPHWHGTHVGGIVGAQWNNADSIVGVAWNIRLVSLRVLDANNNGQLADVVSAVSFAGRAGIRILNLSLSGGTYTTAQQNVFRDYPGLLVCAAGNDNRNSNLATNLTAPGNPVFPGSFAFDNIISVGATTWDNAVTSNVERRAVNPDNGWGVGRGSNWGTEAVHLFAPGTDIRSTMPGEAYGNASGTSMAAPFVAGTAALLLSVNSTLTVAQMKAAIIDTVDVVANLNGLCQTGGRLNAFEAVKRVAFDTTTVGANNVRIDSFATGLKTSTTGSLGVPTTIRFRENNAIVNRTVAEIKSSAFANSQLSQITIPDSVLSIGASAFEGCSSLQTVYIKRTFDMGNITTLGAGAFANCPVLSSIYVYGDMCGYKTSANWANYSQFVKPFDALVNNHNCDPWTLVGIKHSGTCRFCNVKVTAAHDLVPKLIKFKYYYYCKECGFIGAEYTGPINLWSIPEENI